MTISSKNIVAVLVALALLVVGTGIYVQHLLANTDQYLPQIEAYIQQKTGTQIAIHHIQVRVFPTILVRMYGVEIKNPKPFPPGDFLSAKEIDASVEMRALLVGRITILSLVLDQPIIDFISDPDGLWNFQNPEMAKQQTARLSMGEIRELQIKRGTLLGSALIDPKDIPGPVVLRVQDLSVQLRQIDFHKRSNTNSTQPIRGKLEAGAAMFGNVHTKNLQSELQILPVQITLKNFSAKTYRGHASGDFTFNFSDKQTRFDTKVRVSGLGVAYLLSEFETGPPKMTGMMEATMNLNGVVEHTANPLAGIQGAGTFTIRDGEMPSLNHNKDMTQIKRYRNSAAASLPSGAFNTFAGDIQMAKQRIYSKRLGVDFYGVEVNGAGTLEEVTGGMDYRGSATILKKQGFFTDVFARMFKDAQLKDGRLTFPIRVAGTLSNPQFSIVD